MNEGKVIITGKLDIKGRLDIACRIYSVKGISPTVVTCAGGGHIAKIIEYEEDIRD